MQPWKYSDSLASYTQESAVSKVQWILWGPIAVTLFYPFLLDAFHYLVTDDQGHRASLTLATAVLAALLLLGVFAVPAMGLALACKKSRAPYDDVTTTRARRLALMIVAAPTLYCFIGVNSIMLGSPVSDQSIWVAGWLLLGCVLTFARKAPLPQVKRSMRDLAWLRVAHGVAGVIVLLFVTFHLFNHLFGLISPEAHTAVMEVGRQVYRAPFVEPVLVVALLFQVFSGLRLAWSWSAHSVDAYRIVQIGSGVFLAVFILGHLNAVFIFARTYAGIETGWAFASGDPVGMLHDPWSIRLLPHYAIGVFFVLTHLVSGLRVVLLAHGVPRLRVNNLWWAGAGASALVSLLIMLGMTGTRLG